jgi:hypothetical protein
MTTPSDIGPLTGEAALGGLLVLEHLTEFFTISAALSEQKTVEIEKVLAILEMAKRDPTLFPARVVAAFEAIGEVD